MSNNGPPPPVNSEGGFCLHHKFGHLFGSLIFVFTLNIVFDRILRIHVCPKAFKPSSRWFGWRILIYRLGVAATSLALLLSFEEDDDSDAPPPPNNGGVGGGGGGGGGGGPGPTVLFGRLLQQGGNNNNDRGPPPLDSSDPRPGTYLTSVIITFISIVIIALCIYFTSARYLRSRNPSDDQQDLEELSVHLGKVAAYPVKDDGKIAPFEEVAETKRNLLESFSSRLDYFERKGRFERLKMLVLLVVMIGHMIFDITLLVISYSVICRQSDGNFLIDWLTIMMLVYSIASWFDLLSVLRDQVNINWVRNTKESMKNEHAKNIEKHFVRSKSVVVSAGGSNDRPTVSADGNASEIDTVAAQDGVKGSDPPSSNWPVAQVSPHEGGSVVLATATVASPNEEKGVSDAALEDDSDRAALEDAKIDLRERLKRRVTFAAVLARSTQFVRASRKAADRRILQNDYYQHFKPQFVDDMLQDSAYLMHYFVLMERDEPGRLTPDFKPNDLRALAGLVAGYAVKALLKGWDDEAVSPLTAVQHQAEEKENESEKSVGVVKPPVRVSVVVLRLTSMIVTKMVRAARWSRKGLKRSMYRLLFSIQQLAIPLALQDAFNTNSLVLLQGAGANGEHSGGNGSPGAAGFGDNTFLLTGFKTILAKWNNKFKAQKETTVAFVDRVRNAFNLHQAPRKIIFLRDLDSIEDNTDFGDHIFQYVREEYELLAASPIMHQVNARIIPSSSLAYHAAAAATSGAAPSAVVSAMSELEQHERTVRERLWIETMNMDKNLAVHSHTTAGPTVVSLGKSELALEQGLEHNAERMEAGNGVGGEIDRSGSEQSLSTVTTHTRRFAWAAQIWPYSAVFDLRNTTPSSGGGGEADTSKSRFELQRRATIRRPVSPYLDQSAVGTTRPAPFATEGRGSAMSAHARNRMATANGSGNDYLAELQQQDADYQYSLWRSSLVQTLHVAISGQVVYAMFLGFACNRFFRCFLHFGKPGLDYSEWTILATSLTIISLVIIAWYLYTGHQWFTTITPIVAIWLGGWQALYHLSATLDDETFLGLPPQYDLTDSVQAHLIPLLYGIMHVCLLIFAVLPLTMCRWVLEIVLPKVTSSFDSGFISHLVPVHNMFYIHRVLGYSLVVGLMLGAAAWWFAMYHHCAEFGSDTACPAFLPEGSYIDIRGAPFFCKKETLDARAEDTVFRELFPYERCAANEDGNAGAVLFLREVVVTALVAMLITAGLKYPILPLHSDDAAATAATTAAAAVGAGAGGKDLAAGGARSASSVSTVRFISSLLMRSQIYLEARRLWVALQAWIKKNSFELFLYTHVLGAYAIAAGAFFSRFEVFYPSAVFWSLYVVDKIVIRTCYTHEFECACEEKGRNLIDAFRLRLRKSKHASAIFDFWNPKAGQIVYIQCPDLDKHWMGLQWHPFSISHISRDRDTFELLVKVHPTGWTGLIKNTLFKTFEEGVEADDAKQKKGVLSRGISECYFWSSCLFRKQARLSDRLSVNFNVMGPFGSAFQDLGEYDFVMLIGGGAGIASSLSLVQELQAVLAVSSKQTRVWFIWSTRALDSVLWCWESLKQTLADADGAYSIRISIHVTQKGGLTDAEKRAVAYSDAGDDPLLLSKLEDRTLLNEDELYARSIVGNVASAAAAIATRHAVPTTADTTERRRAYSGGARAVGILSTQSVYDLRAAAGGALTSMGRKSSGEVPCIEQPHEALAGQSNHRGGGQQREESDGDIGEGRESRVLLQNCIRMGRPDWSVYVEEFNAQAYAANHVKRAKIIACGPKMLYGEVQQALNSNQTNRLEVEFHTENFE